MSGEKLFGTMLSTARKLLGWTQEELAGKLKPPANRVTVSRWEHDAQKTSVHYRKQLVEILGFNQEEADAFHRAAGEAPSPQVVVDSLPFPRNPFFTGREQYLEHIHQSFFPGSSYTATNQVVCISGLGGIGKTQLALEYAYLHYQAGTYRTVFWVDATSYTTLASSFKNIHRQLFGHSPERQDVLLPSGQAFSGVSKWLHNHSGWIMVIDNIENAQVPNIWERLDGIPQMGSLLLTSRSQIVHELGVTTQIKLERFTDHEGLIFLLRCSGLLQDATLLHITAKQVRQDAAWLVESLGGHALALDQVGAYIYESGISLKEYIQLYHQECQSLLDTYSLSGIIHSAHPETVASTIRLSVRRAAELQYRTNDILHFCSCLEGEIIPEEIIRADYDLSPDNNTFHAAVSALRRYSLIERNAEDKTYSIHNIVRTVVAQSMSAELIKQWRRRVIHAISLLCQQGIDPDSDLFLWLDMNSRAVDEWNDDDPAFIKDKKVYKEWRNKDTVGRFPPLRGEA